MARLDALRAVATEDRLEAEVQLGGHVSVVPELEAAVGEHPFRERLWGLLMIALYRSGRQAEALRAYDRARLILREHLGVDPSPTLRALEADVLSQVPTLEWRPPALEDDERALIVAPPSAAPTAVVSTGELVGRRHQLDTLERALAQARGGQGRLVLLAGEAGIGKTRLAEELAARAEAEGATLAWGRAYETEGAPPFWPWTQVVRGLLTTVEPADLASLDGAGELAKLMPEVKELVGPGERAPTAGPGAARFRLYEAVVELLLLVSSRRLLVVLIDDLHWADPLSVHLLAHLGERVDAARLLVVATYRSPDGAESAPVSDVLGRLARLRTVERLVVPGLSSDEVGRFMAQAGGFQSSPEQVATVHARTEGNPFFVAELARLMASEDLPTMESVPAGVVDVVRRRLDRLPEPTRGLLVVGSVVGRDFDLAVVAAASGLELDGTVDLIEAAVAIGVVTEDVGRPGHYRFSHAVVRDTVYAQISGLRRARLHVRVGEAVAALPDADGRTAELANHFFRGAVVDGPERGLAYALLAHEEARSSLAYEQAEDHLRRGLEMVAMMPPGQERMRNELRVQNRLAAILTVADGFTAPSATRGWDRARQLSDDVDDTAQGLASSWGMLSLSCVRGDVEATSRLARQFLLAGSRPDQAASLMAGHFGLGRAALFCGDLREALAQFSRARALCDSLDDRARLDVFGWLDPAVLCRVNAALVHGLLGDRREAADWAADGTCVAERAGHPLSVGAALMFNAAVALLGDDGPLVRRHAEALYALATEHRLPDFVAAATIFGGWAKARTGEVEAGVAEIHQGIATKRATGFRMWQTLDLGLLGDAYRRSDRLEEAVAAVAEALAEVEAVGERFYAAELYRLRGELVVGRRPDATDDARGWFAKAIAVATAQDATPFRRNAEASLARIGTQPAPVRG